MFFSKEDAKSICDILNKQARDPEGWVYRFDEDSQSYQVCHFLGAGIVVVNFRTATLTFEAGKYYQSFNGSIHQIDIVGIKNVHTTDGYTFKISDGTPIDNERGDQYTLVREVSVTDVI